MNKTNKERLKPQTTLTEGQNQLFRGKVKGHYLTYIPLKSLLAKKNTYEAYKSKMHGEVILTIAAIRERNYPEKRVPRKCFGCKRYQTVHCTTT